MLKTEFKIQAQFILKVFIVLLIIMEKNILIKIYHLEDIL